MTDKISAAQAGTINFGELTVNRLGLGTNRIYDNEAGHELLKRAVELGINFIDTAHSYADGESEAAIGNALAPFGGGLVVATKGGMGAGASPKQLRTELEESLKRLQTKRIDLYQLHRIDAATPLADSLGALKQFRDEGLIGAIGLSEVNVEQLTEAVSIVPIASVQNEYNLSNRKYDPVLEYCAEHDIAFIPWYPLGGRHEDAAKIRSLAEPLSDKYDATPQQIALAWLLQRSPMMLPIPGTTSPEHLESNLRAALISLSDEDYAALTSAKI